jgi:RimJ/RimL family protein N-acetyltransferase
MESPFMINQVKTSSSSLESSQFNIVIETDRLILRPFRDEDVKAVYDIATQPDFHFLRLRSSSRYAPELGRYPTKEDVWNSAEALVHYCQESMQPGFDGLPNELKLAICLKDKDNQVIGYRSLGPLHDPEGKTRDIGTFVHKDYQCNGYSSEAGKGIIGAFYWLADQYPQLFSGENLHVNATVHPHNIASQKGLTNMFFENTGEVTKIDVQGVEEDRLCFLLNKDAFLSKENHVEVKVGQYAYGQWN